ncbi:hypothetical protein JCM10212_002587 [Sporobolomyces blumeae]
MAPPKPKLATHQADPTLLPSDDESDDSDFHLDEHDHDDGGSDSSDSERDDPTSRATRGHPSNGESEPPALTKSAVDDLWASFNDPSLDDPYAVAASAPTAAAVASTSSSSSTAVPAVADPSHSTSRASISTETPVSQPVVANGQGKGKARAHEDGDLVEIEVTYEFAGEKISQSKRVPRTSREAQAYFALHPPHPHPRGSTFESPQSGSSGTNPSVPRSTAPSSIDALFGPEADPVASKEPDSSTSTTTTTATATTAMTTTTAPRAEATDADRPPPPRKRKAPGGGLGALASSLGVGPGAKPPKLNTLEKSKLDWDSYVSKETGLSDTLSHARKDGYLEKRDFLDRVERRKEEGYEAGKKKARR